MRKWLLKKYGSFFKYVCLIVSKRVISCQKRYILCRF
nr:MAG TPA_asm: hypothetical protein [Bacteriophage sp.]